MRWNAETASPGSAISIAKIVLEHSTSRRHSKYFTQRLHRYPPHSSLRDFRLQIQHAATDRDEQVRKVTTAIDTISGFRIRRADLTSSQDELEELNEGLTRLRRDNDKSEFCDSNSRLHSLNSFAAKQRLRALREGLATRRRTLSQAKLLPLAPLDVLITRETSQLSVRAETVSRARSGLVSELVEVFNIVEVGGRPPIGGKAGTKGEWTIGDLVLPVPGDIRRTRFFFLRLFFLLIWIQGTLLTISTRS